MKKDKKKKRRGKAALITILVIVAVFAVLGIVGWNMLQKEHQEILSMEFEALDFSSIQDGVYTGGYAGGLYGWRENRVKVTVEGGKVVGVEVIYSKDGTSDAILDELYSRVIESQSLDVDTVSEATLTSKAYLKSVEDALVKAND